MTTFSLPNLPIPPGATAGGWDEMFDDDGAVRSLAWFRHDAAGIGIGVDGLQHEDGRIDRYIGLYNCSNPELTSGQARALATALMEAADEYDRLDRVRPTRAAT